MVMILPFMLFLIQSIYKYYLMLSRCLILLHGFLFFSLFCFSQNEKNYTVDAEQATEIYNKEFYNKYRFLFGKEYKLYHVALETSPLFDASLTLEGTVFSNGESYPAMLAYDIFKDEIVFVSELFKDCNFIRINKSVVDSFSLITKPSSKSPLQLKREKTYHFVKVDFPEKTNIPLNDGYYEVTTIGDKKLLIQHKAIQNNNEGEEAIVHGIFRYDYIQNKILYVNGNYYDIDKKRKLIKLFPRYKKSINKKLSIYATRYDMLSKSQLIEVIQLTNPR